jgi:hypothetical protein
VSDGVCFSSGRIVKMETVVRKDHLKDHDAILKVQLTWKKGLLFVLGRFVNDWNIKFNNTFYKQASGICSVLFPYPYRIVFKHT